MSNDFIIKKVKEIHFKIVEKLQKKISKSQEVNRKKTKYTEEAGDVSYDIDIEAENIVLEMIEEMNIGYNINLVMEGVGIKTICKACNETVTFIIDPVDGTREILYDKRSAWILTGISFNNNPGINDIQIAIQTEIPTSKQILFSHLFSVKGQGSYEEVYNKESFALEKTRKPLKTSQATDIEDGYVCFPMPYPGIKIKISEIYERFCNGVFPASQINDAKVFSDEYISTGGQVYLLASGCYRIVADIRDYVQMELKTLCCHPYDLCTILIAAEAGAVIVDHTGNDINYPLDTKTNCNWLGFANIILKEKYMDALIRLLGKSCEQS